jgi:hypothetical protein
LVEEREPQVLVVFFGDLGKLLGRLHGPAPATRSGVTPDCSIRVTAHRPRNQASRKAAPRSSSDDRRFAAGPSDQRPGSRQRRKPLSSNLNRDHIAS